MKIIDKAVDFAIQTARDDTHGYSQSNRWGNPDYDCSSFVISAYKQAGLPLQSTYTGDMLNDLLSHGFIPVNLNSRQRGDILLYHNSGSDGHTAIYLGDGLIAHARSSEGNNIPGDGNGREIVVANYYDGGWQYCLRYMGEDNGESGDSIQYSDSDGSNGSSAVESAPTSISPVRISGLEMIRSGDKGQIVKSLQLLLIGNKFSCGWYGADGEFGSATEKAVRKFQQSMGIEVDGIVGPDTWTYLIKVGNKE